MASVTVLVVDDEQALRDFVRRNLEDRGYTIVSAADGSEALAIFNALPLDLVVLDVRMPRLDGFETTRRIRQQSETPIIVLTAPGEESDKIRLFDLGADDYLTKPFTAGELLERVKAVLRRARWSPPEAGAAKVEYDDVRVEPESHRVTVRDQPTHLTPTEYSLLVYFMQHAGNVLTHEDILQHVWGASYGSETELLRAHISRLRGKIEADPLRPRYLLTQGRVGYRFGE